MQIWSCTKNGYVPHPQGSLVWRADGGQMTSWMDVCKSDLKQCGIAATTWEDLAQDPHVLARNCEERCAGS